MILGTRSRPRPRHSIKRTTSMTEFSFDDLSFLNHPQPPPPPSDHTLANDTTTKNDIEQPTLAGLVSPLLLPHRRNSADFAPKSSSSCSFLRSCSLCRCRLARGRDIFMYKGDTAFCSSECRQQQMAQDEWKEKCVTKQSSSTSEDETEAA
ncbi:hypothetical protein vseg_011712 [Gypsophila vaccaria]